MRLLRLIVFAPAAVLAFAAPSNAETFVESFDNGTVEQLSVSLAPGARYCSEYSGLYGTSGPSLCLFGTTAGTVFDFPSDVYVQGFEFIAGAKNGTTELTATYDDGTTGMFPIDGSCCETTVRVLAPEGQYVVSFSIPADPDLWLLDTLTWWGDATPPTTTTTEPEMSESSTTTAPLSTSTTPETSTTSTVVTPPPPPPPDTQAPVETTVPDTTSTFPSTSVAPSTTETPATIPPPATSTTSSEPPPATTLAPPATETTLPAPAQDDSPVQVPQEPLIQEPPADASPEEKAAFESQVNVFSGTYDNYVPLGSRVTVAQRRTVVAVTAVLIIMMPVPSTMRRRP